MSENFFKYLLGFAVSYALCGVISSVAFMVQSKGGGDPAVQKGTWGFRLLVLPGLIALWPLFLLARRIQPSSFADTTALSLRRTHFIAIIALAFISALIFVAALVEREPGFWDLPVIETPLL